MKKAAISMVWGLFVVCILCATESGSARIYVPDQDTGVVDSLKNKPAHSAVNVVIETEWSDPETVKNVDVYIKYEKGIPSTIELKSKSRDCDIALISGVTVKIIDSQTGKKLATYSGPQELPVKK